MARETTATRERRPPTADPDPGSDGSNTAFNALVGAVATVVTAPLLPFAAVVGGGLAGYLERGTTAEGAKVGAVAGAIAAVPVAVLLWLVVGLLFIGGDLFFGVTTALGALVFVLVAGYLVGAGALGGALGAYVRREL